MTPITPKNISPVKHITDLREIAESGITNESVEAFERLRQIDARLSAQRLTLYISLGLLAVGLVLMLVLCIHLIYDPNEWAFGSTSFVTALNGYFFQGFYRIIKHHYPERH